MFAKRAVPRCTRNHKPPAPGVSPLVGDHIAPSLIQIFGLSCRMRIESQPFGEFRALRRGANRRQAALFRRSVFSVRDVGNIRIAQIRGRVLRIIESDDRAAARHA